jgi:hypothetical protein
MALCCKRDPQRYRSREDTGGVFRAATKKRQRLYVTGLYNLKQVLPQRKDYIAD